MFQQLIRAFRKGCIYCYYLFISLGSQGMKAAYNTAGVVWRGAGFPVILKLVVIADFRLTFLG